MPLPVKSKKILGIALSFFFIFLSLFLILWSGEFNRVYDFGSFIGTTALSALFVTVSLVGHLLLSPQHHQKGSRLSVIAVWTVFLGYCLLAGWWVLMTLRILLPLLIFHNVWVLVLSRRIRLNQLSRRDKYLPYYCALMGLLVLAAYYANYRYSYSLDTALAYPHLNIEVSAHDCRKMSFFEKLGIASGGDIQSQACYMRAALSNCDVKLCEQLNYDTDRMACIEGISSGRAYGCQ